MIAGTELSRLIQELEKMKLADVHRLLIAATCVVSISNGVEPEDILWSLKHAFEDEWETIRQAILVRQFEDQMQTGAPLQAPV